jgi:hypothetical protein
MQTVIIVSTDLDGMKKGEDRHPLMVATYENGKTAYGRVTDGDVEEFAPTVTCEKGHCSTPFNAASSSYDHCDDCEAGGGNYTPMWKSAWYGLNPEIGTTSTLEQYETHHVSEE